MFPGRPPPRHRRRPNLKPHVCPTWRPHPPGCAASARAARVRANRRDTAHDEPVARPPAVAYRHRGDGRRRRDRLHRRNGPQRHPDGRHVGRAHAVRIAIAHRGRGRVRRLRPEHRGARPQHQLAAARQRRRGNPARQRDPHARPTLPVRRRRLDALPADQARRRTRRASSAATTSGRSRSAPACRPGWAAPSSSTFAARTGRRSAATCSRAWR